MEFLSRDEVSISQKLSTTPKQSRNSVHCEVPSVSLSQPNAFVSGRITSAVLPGVTIAPKASDSDAVQPMIDFLCLTRDIVAADNLA